MLKIQGTKSKYQEKPYSLRAQQASRKKEFLGKESEERLRRYQQAGTGNHKVINVPNDPQEYAGIYHSSHAAHLDSYRERTSFPRRSQGAEGYHTLGDETMTKLVLGTSGLVLKEAE